jgi:superfamily II DNA/RNA helicase
VARPNATATNVEQRFYSVADDDKRAVVRQLLKQRELSQAIIFVNSKLGAAGWHVPSSATACAPRRCMATSRRTNA